MNKSIYKIKKIFNKVLSTALVLSLIITVTTISFASDASTNGGVDTVVGDINAGGDGIYGTIGQIIGILSMLGFLIAIGKMIQIGMLFMIGAGKGKNDAKASLIPWLVGAVICAMFGTIGPWIIGLIMGDGSGGVFDI